MTGVLNTVCLSPGAGVIYLDICRSAIPTWILQKEAKEACSNQTPSVGH